MRSQILAHLVAGYPSIAETVPIAKAFAAGGVGAIELQLPYSDPVADGPVIEHACHHALSASNAPGGDGTGGVTVADGLRLAQEITAATSLPVYCMAYAAILYRIGIAAFVARAHAAGVHGIIVPDLPIEHDEGLAAACTAHGIHPVAVIQLGGGSGTDTNSSSTYQQECIQALGASPAHTTVYCALRRGITGTDTQITPSQLDALSRLKSLNKKTIAGFGIKTPAQVAALAGTADYIVIGSHFMRILTRALQDGHDYLDALQKECTALHQPLH